MKNQNEQLGLFTEQAFEQRDSEQELKEAKANLEEAEATEFHVVHHCFYYLAAGNCVKHGDAIGCADCSDYKSVYGDDIEDDDYTIIFGVVAVRG